MDSFSPKKSQWLKLKIKKKKWKYLFWQDPALAGHGVGRIVWWGRLRERKRPNPAFAA